MQTAQCTLNQNKMYRLRPFGLVQGRMASVKKPACKFGAKCYRKSKQHRQEYSHGEEEDEEVSNGFFRNNISESWMSEISF